MKTFVVSGGNGLLGKSILEILSIRFPEAQICALARSEIAMNKVKTVLWDLPYKFPERAELPKSFHYIHTANLLKSNLSDDFDKINVDALNTFLNLYKDQIKSIIWSSSLSVLGQGPFNNAKETSILNPQTDLAKSRLKQEELIMDFAKSRKIPCVGLRARLYIGPEEKEFNSYLQMIMKKPYLAFNQGKTLISVIDHNDYAKVVCEFLSRDFQFQEIFNIAYSRPLSISEFLKTMQVRLNFSLPSSLLKLISKALPHKTRNSIKTKLELLAQNQVMDVSKLQNYLKNDLLDQDPHLILKKYFNK